MNFLCFFNDCCFIFEEFIWKILLFFLCYNNKRNKSILVIVFEDQKFPWLYINIRIWDHLVLFEIGILNAIRRVEELNRGFVRQIVQLFKINKIRFILSISRNDIAAKTSRNTIIRNNFGIIAKLNFSPVQRRLLL